MMSKLSSTKVILGICHGKTEIEFFRSVSQLYLASLFNEKFEEEIIYDANIEEPRIIPLDKAINKNPHVTINNYENDLMNIFPRRNQDYFLIENTDNKENSIIFATFIDVHENEEKLDRYKFIVENQGHKKVIKDILKDNTAGICPSSFQESYLFYFNKGIERHFVGLRELEKTSKNKPEAMRTWIKNNIISVEGEITTKRIRDLIKENNGTNILGYFDLLDELIMEIKKAVEE